MNFGTLLSNAVTTVASLVNFCFLVYKTWNCEVKWKTNQQSMTKHDRQYVSANLMSFFSVTLLEMDYSKHFEHYFRVALLEYCTFNVSIIILVSVCVYIYTHTLFIWAFLMKFQLNFQVK